MIYTRKKVRGTLFTLIPKDIIDLMKEIQGSKYMVGFTPVLNNYSNFINLLLSQTPQGTICIRRCHQIPFK